VAVAMFHPFHLKQASTSGQKRSLPPAITHTHTLAYQGQKFTGAKMAPKLIQMLPKSKLWCKKKESVYKFFVSDIYNQYLEQTCFFFQNISPSANVIFLQQFNEQCLNRL